MAPPEAPIYRAPMIQKPLAGRLIAAAHRFETLAPWRQISDREPIAFELPEEPQPVYAVTLGNAGIAFGLNLYRGNLALDQIRLFATEARPPLVTTTLMLEFEPPAASPPEACEVARAAGVVGRIIPTFFAVEAGGRGRAPNNRELRLFLRVLDAYAKAEAQDLLRPRRFEPHRTSKVLTLRVTGEGKTVEVTARFVDVPSPDPAPQALASLPWPLPELPVVDEHWVIGLERVPIDLGEGPLQPGIVAAIDAATGKLVGMQVVTKQDDPLDLESSVDAFAHACTEPTVGDGRLPRRITFTHRRLGEALTPGLTHLGVEVECTAEHPLVRSAFDQFAARARGTANPDHIPEPTDTAAWDAVHDRMRKRISDEFEHVDVYARKPLEQFFGEERTFAKLEQAGITDADNAYLQWYFARFRPKRNRPTIAERLLEQDLPAAERALVQAHIDARAGIYRVTEVRPPLLVVRDVLSDYEAEIIDGRAAAQLEVEQVLTVRIGEAAGHRFLIPVGPRLGFGGADAAISFLEDLFDSCTSKDLQRQPQRLGELWGWALARTARPGPKLQNTDGDPLRMMVATFAVEEWEVVLRELGGREDVEVVEEAESWTWVRDDGGPGGVGGKTILANLQRVGDELLVNVNSEARLAAVRGWLEELGVVAFVRVRQVESAAAPAGKRGRSLGSASAEPMGDDLADIQAMFEARCMQWVDEQIPALGGKTPREAVRNAAGREAVLRLIRSWPDPMGMQGLRVPRERMREELGLGGAAESGG